MTSDPRPRAPAAPSRPHRARRGEGGRLRVELLEAAGQLLVERGHPDAVSMRAIAQRVGVTPAAIYMHFADKEELFFLTCEQRFLGLGEMSLEALQELGEASAPDRLRALGRAYVRWGLTNREYYAVIMGGSIGLPEGVDATDLAGRSAFLALMQITREGMDAGEIRDDIRPVDAAAHLWSCVHGYVSLVTARKQDFVPELDLPGAEDAVIEAAVRGLLPPVPSAPSEPTARPPRRPRAGA